MRSFFKGKSFANSFHHLRDHYIITELLTILHFHSCACTDVSPFHLDFTGAKLAISEFNFHGHVLVCCGCLSQSSGENEVNPLSLAKFIVFLFILQEKENHFVSSLFKICHCVLPFKQLPRQSWQDCIGFGALVKCLN